MANKVITGNSFTRILARLGWKSKHAPEAEHVPPLVTPDYLQVHILGELKRAHLGSLLMAIAVARTLKQPLKVWICSQGGDLLTAFAIHDALRRNPDVEMIATGDCQSAALVAFLGARKRLATPNTIFLRHEVQGDTPMPFGLAAMDALAKCPEGFFDSVAALADGIVQEIV